MSISFPSYVVIEGPIGVGKTSLAKRLAETFGNELLLEGHEENPFLEKYYDHPKSAALATQLFFLFQRSKQLQKLRQDDLFETVRIADFLIEKDQLFAQLTLDDDEYDLYHQVYQTVSLDAPAPDLVVYLQAPTDVLLKRIHKRGRNYERAIDTDYLQRLNEAYANFFYHYSRSPLLIVNAAEIDLVANEHDYENLLKEINKVKSGRHFFNPIPFDM